MDALSPPPPGAGRWQPLLWTTLGPTICTLPALGLNAMLFAEHDAAAYETAMISGFILPLVIGVPIFFYFSLKMRDLAIANHRLGILAATDGLTACLNRNAFELQVRARVSDERRLIRSGALLIVDADRFKLINDRYGHQAGDRALELIAETLRATIRAGDLIGRLGGEEFGVFLPNIDPVSAGRVAERLRVAVSGIAFIANGKRHPLSVSIGGVSFDDTANFESLFRQADDRLYHAKESGRNRVAMTNYAMAGTAS